jgi:hypothetical protein
MFNPGRKAPQHSKKEIIMLSFNRKRLVLLALMALSLLTALTTSVGTQEAQARICCSACEVDPMPLPCYSGCSPSC